MYALPLTSTITKSQKRYSFISNCNNENSHYFFSAMIRAYDCQILLPVLWGPMVGPNSLTVATNSLPTIDLFLKVSPCDKNELTN